MKTPELLKFVLIWSALTLFIIAVFNTAIKITPSPEFNKDVAYQQLFRQKAEVPDQGSINDIVINAVCKV